MSEVSGYIEHLCEVMHDAYEAAAVQEGWETQERSRKPWSEVPEANKATMRVAVLALRDQVLEDVLKEVHAENRWQEEKRRRSQNLDTRLTHRYLIERLTIVADCIKQRLGANPPRSNHDTPSVPDLPGDLEGRIAAVARSQGPAEG